MKKIIIANWKMNPHSEAEAEKLFEAYAALSVPKKVEAAVAAPSPYLALGKRHLTKIALGAQDAYWMDKAAATGEVSPAMLKDLGVKYVIVGHSETRKALKESDEDVWRKLAAVQLDGMTPVLCVGEPQKVRKLGEKEAVDYVLRQLLANAETLITYCTILGSAVIAYEPVWAISTSGSGMAQPEPEDAARMISVIRDTMVAKCHLEGLRVIYGGTVNRETAAGFLGRKEIDGALVGQASLDPAEFQEILNAAGK
jgi:triosephosphate isomerase